MKNNSVRCAWVSNDPLYIDYHDNEWGRPCYDSHYLFEMLCLEGAQAGLSWITVLKKRENYRRLFDDFDANKMSVYGEEKIEALLQDAGIIRNRLKVNAFITNAKSYLAISERQSFSQYIWQFVDGSPVLNHWKSARDVPITTPESDKMSHALKKDGFKFVGSTICYAYMQAVGMVNDHTLDCLSRQKK